MFLDLLDDFVFGPLNLINRAEGALHLWAYQDFGTQFAIQREDKGGQHSLSGVRSILARYGVPLFGCTHDSRHIYFIVKRRQSVWAEYLLSRAGVELKGAVIYRGNLQSNHPQGWMPRPWGNA